MKKHAVLLSAWVSALGLGGALAGCGSPSEPAGTTLEVALGQDQTGEVGRILAQPVWISLRTSAGPVAGVPITLTVMSGDGYITIPGRTAVGGDGGAIDELTGRDGIAEFFLGMGVTAGEHRFAASAQDVATGQAAVVVRAVAEPGPIANVVKGGDAQAGPSGELLPILITVTLSDQFGNPRGNVPVEWVVTGGAGSVSSATSVSDSLGVAATGWRMGPAGAQALDARLDGVGTFSFAATSQ